MKLTSGLEAVKLLTVGIICSPADWNSGPRRQLSFHCGTAAIWRQSKVNAPSLSVPKFQTQRQKPGGRPATPAGQKLVDQEPASHGRLCFKKKKYVSGDFEKFGGDRLDRLHVLIKENYLSLLLYV